MMFGELIQCLARQWMLNNWKTRKRGLLEVNHHQIDLSDHFDIMRKFLNEKDDRKWNYFIDRLGKKDHAILKKLLCAQETSDSDSSKKRKREEKSDESTEDEGKQTKKSKWDGKNFPKKTPTLTPAPKVKQEKDDGKVKKEKKDKNGKSEDQKNS